MRILRTPNTIILFIHIPIECEICFIAEENFVRKIAFHRQFFKHPFHVSTMLRMASWLYGCMYRSKCKICRKTILIPEHDEKSTHSSLRQHFHIFRGTSETMMPRPFNICYPSSLLKFLHNFANCMDDYVNHNLLLKHDSWLWQNHHFCSRVWYCLYVVW